MKYTTASFWIHQLSYNDEKIGFTHKHCTVTLHFTRLLGMTAFTELNVTWQKLVRTYYNGTSRKRLNGCKAWLFLRETSNHTKMWVRASSSSYLLQKLQKKIDDKAKYFTKKFARDDEVHLNLSGCCRDSNSWAASWKNKQRKLWIKLYKNFVRTNENLSNKTNIWSFSAIPHKTKFLFKNF